MRTRSKIFRQTALLASLIIVSMGTAVQAGSSFPLKRGDKVYVITNDRSEGERLQFDNSVKNGIVTGIDNRSLYIGTQWDVRLDRVVKLDGSTVTFPIIGARYDTTTRAVSGMNDIGQVVSIPVAEIDHLEIMWWIKDEMVPTTLSARMLHRRLRFVDSYPEVTNKIPFDSIREIKKWKKGTAKFTFVGMLAGGVLGYHSARPERDKAQDTSWFDFSLSDGAVRTLSTIAGAFAGGVLGHLVGKGGWRKVPIEKMRVSLSPIYNDGFGLKLAVNF